MGSNSDNKKTNNSNFKPEPDIDVPPLKKARTIVTLPIAELPDAIVHNYSIPKSKCMMVIAPGHCFYLKNPSERQVELPAGLVVAEFFKGKWGNEIVAGKESILFELQGSADCVKVSTSFNSLENLITEKQKTKMDEAQVRYHTIVAAPNDKNPGCFTLTREQDVFFVLDPLPAPEDEKGAAQVEHAHIGSAIPIEVWKKFFLLTWICKWTIRGLSPIKPVVVLQTALSLPPMSAVKIE